MPRTENNLARIKEWQRRIAIVRQAYVRNHGRRASIFFPRLYSEKIQWRKLFGSEPLYRVFCDKLATRKYIQEKGFGDLLPELIWSGGELSASPIRSLTFPVVLKSSHASGQYVFVHDPTSVDYDALSEESQRWLDVCWGELTSEAGYLGIPRCLMIERMIRNPDGSQPIEHRMFVFHGKVKLIGSMIVSGGVFSQFHTADWQRLHWKATNDPYGPDLPTPERLDEMIAISENLCAGSDHLRIDFYDDRERLYVGEITLYPWSGHQAWVPKKADGILGGYWKLAWPASKAMAKIALGKWGG